MTADGKRTIASFFAPKPKRQATEAGGSGNQENREPKENESHQGSGAADGGSRRESSLSPTQALRCRASKNAALAKLAAKDASGRGEPPELRALLVEKTWQAIVSGEFEKPYFKQLEKFVQQEWAGRVPVFPAKPAVFRAFNAVPFDMIKVVVLGQDPYHGPKQAVGLCFSVPQTEKRPSSLLNIYKELQADCGCRIPGHGNIDAWATQGVFMLNTVLTVRAHQANSHAKKGWEAFTDAAIQSISRGRSGVVFLLWGKQAQDKARLIDASKHHILKSAHPSGLSAHRGFFGCKHFSQANELLEAQGLGAIDWQV